MKRGKNRRSRGIWVRGYVPMLFLISALCITIYIYIGSSGMPLQLQENSNQTMRSVVQARSESVASGMTQRWSEMTAAVQTVNSIYDELVIKQGYTMEEIVSQEKLYVEFLNETIEPSIELLRRNMVSGVYIVLADENSVMRGDTNSLPGIYLRDRDPSSAYNNTNKDLLFERAPVAVVQQSGISTDSFWVPNFSIGMEGDLADAFLTPYKVALASTDDQRTELGYWSTTAGILNDTTKSFFYSFPLISSSGEVFGVIGIDITRNYFGQSVPHYELSDGAGAYALYKRESDGSVTFVQCFSKTGRYMDDFWQGLSINPNVEFQIMEYAHNEDYMVQVSKMKIYGDRSPFAGEDWYLCAAVPASVLYKTTTETMRYVSFLVIWIAVVSVIGVGSILYQIASPIKRLERQLKASQLESDELNLDTTGIRELDLLATAIEQLNADVRNNVGKFSQLLEMSRINLGAFEFHRDTGQGFISYNFFNVFGDSTPSKDLDLASTMERLKYYQSSAIAETVIDTEENYECVYERTVADGLDLFVRIKIEKTPELIRGFVEDVSIEWREIRKLAYERNHDNLTDIYNRRGFYEQYYALMAQSPELLKTAAVIMFDLDNLKVLNDTYGHDTGDRYIRAMANVLKIYANKQIIVSRISGDEFLAFVYGYESQAECNRFLTILESQLALEQIPIGEDSYYPLQVSAGIAYYPMDSTESNLLVQFADFAMYQGKRNVKGRFNFFDRAIYDKEELRIRSKEALSRIIIGCTLEFHFQPILNAKTGEVFAYEALMRPQNDLLKSPADVLQVARQENHLDDIEKLTFFVATKSFAHWCNEGVISNPQCKLFLNTITSERLSEESLELYEKEYASYLSRIVIEYTEEEKAKEEIMVHKSNIMQRWGGQIALDDYGSGYNGETMLLDTDAKYIKMDINMIKNIHMDENRQQRVKDLLNYAHSRGISIIAEGVEMHEEYVVLQQLGVDFLQGYYFARPAKIPQVPDVGHLFPQK